MQLEQEIKQEKFKTEDEKLTVNLIFTHYWLLDKLKDRLRPYDISMQQYNVLRILRGQGDKPASINLLKERMLDKSSDASRLVERLRIKGLVDRIICPMDRRAVEIRISGKGLELLKNIDKDDLQSKEISGTLKADEVHKLNDLLDKLRD